ncbi:MAG: hypothetical protein ACOC7J_02985 [Armatimonadota bacterium]
MMLGRLRWERRAGAGTIATFFAIGVCMLLVNAISLAPATHHHEAPHNPNTCPVCTLTATGSWAPAPSPPAPVLHRVAFVTPEGEPSPHLSGVHPLPPARGPPANA